MSYASNSDILHFVGLRPASKQAVPSFLLLAGRVRPRVSGRRAWDAALPFRLREPWAFRAGLFIRLRSRGLRRLATDCRPSRAGLRSSRRMKKLTPTMGRSRALARNGTPAL